MEQTAVEWLAHQIMEIIGKTPLSQKQEEMLIFNMNQALEMEEKQHQETFKQSRLAKIFEKDMPPVWESWEEYYNETYKSE